MIAYIQVIIVIVPIITQTSMKASFTPFPSCFLILLLLVFYVSPSTLLFNPSSLFASSSPSSN